MNKYASIKPENQIVEADDVSLNQRNDCQTLETWIECVCLFSHMLMYICMYVNAYGYIKKCTNISGGISYQWKNGSFCVLYMILYFMFSKIRRQQFYNKTVSKTWRGSPDIKHFYISNSVRGEHSNIMISRQSFARTNYLRPFKSCGLFNSG